MNIQVPPTQGTDAIRRAAEKVIRMPKQGEQPAPKEVGAPPRGRPFGRFYISKQLYDESWRECLSIFQGIGVVPVKIEYDYAIGMFLVTGLSDAFELCPTGWEPALYGPNWDEASDTLTFVKIQEARDLGLSR